MNRCVVAKLIFIASLTIGVNTGSSNHSSAADPAAGQHENGGSCIHFDLPSVAVAIPAKDNPELVTVELPLSSMIVSTETPDLDHWIVRCQPRDSSLRITDYAPRTETGSELSSPIQIKSTSESSRSLGIGFDANYAHLARVNGAGDKSDRETASVQFDRVAPLHAVTAAGTINRGRGVYFKLRWTAQQILEGEKTFRLTFKVPSQWRGSLIDVSVVAQGQRKTFGWERESKTIGQANFVVSVFREGDVAAEKMAYALAESEHQLRVLARNHRKRSSENYSIPSVIRHVAHRFDPDSHDHASKSIWLDRLLSNRADPNLDPQISRLPMPIRVAILDYADRRDDFLQLNHS